MKTYHINGKFQFYDDCGEWNHEKKIRNPYYFLRDDIVQVKKHKNNIVSEGRLITHELAPTDIIELVKLTHPYKKDDNFIRTIWLLCDSDSSLALYQYCGTQP